MFPSFQDPQPGAWTGSRAVLGQRSSWSLGSLGRDSGDMRCACCPELPAPALHALRCAWQAAPPTRSVQLAVELHVPSSRPRGERFALVSQMPALSPQPLLLAGSPALSWALIWPCECPLDRVRLGFAKTGKAANVRNCNMSALPWAELGRICKVLALKRGPEIL